MKRKIQIIICLILILLGGMKSLKFLERICISDEKWYYEILEPIDMKAAKRIQDTCQMEQINILLWGIADYQSVYVTAPVKRESDVSIIAICGNPEYLTGNYSVPIYGDTLGCLVDIDTAYELFGTKEVKGQWIKYQEKEYQIRGVIEETTQTMVIQASEEDGYEFERMILSDCEEQKKGNVISSLQNRYGMEVKECRWDILKNIVKWFSCAMSIIISFVIIHNIFLTVPYKKSIIILCQTGCIIILARLFIYIFEVHIPIEYIPSKWSDFKFYTKVWKNIVEEINNLIRMKISIYELTMLHWHMGLCMHVFMAETGVLWLFRILNIKNKKLS